MKSNPNTSRHKKRVIKWENIMLIPLMILTVSGIIKSNPNFITIAILEQLLLTSISYYIIKHTRKEAQKNGGLIKAINKHF